MKSITETAKRRFSPDLLYRHPEWFEETIATLESCDPGAYIACCEMLAHNDLTADVAAISLPTLIIAGDLDPTANVEQASWLQDQIGGSELEVMEGAAHLSNLDRAEDFTAALRRFVERPLTKSLATSFVDSMAAHGQPVPARHKRSRRRLRMAGWRRHRPLRRAGLFRDRLVPFLR